MESKSGKSLITRFADAVDRKLDAISPKSREELSKELFAKQQPLRSKKARYYERDANTKFKMIDGTVYGWLDRNHDGKHLELRVAPGMFPKGHAGKVLKKKFRRLHRQGHHSTGHALALLGLSTASSSL
jgi:hypothetical protein